MEEGAVSNELSMEKLSMEKKEGAVTDGLSMKKEEGAVTDGFSTEKEEGLSREKFEEASEIVKKVTLVSKLLFS